MKKRLSMIPRADPKTPGKTGPTGALAGARTPAGRCTCAADRVSRDGRNPRAPPRGTRRRKRRYELARQRATLALAPTETRSGTGTDDGTAVRGFTTGVEKLVDVREPADCSRVNRRIVRDFSPSITSVRVDRTLYTPHVKRVLEDIAEVHRAAPAHRQRRSSSSDRADGDAGAGGRCGRGTGARARAQRSEVSSGGWMNSTTPRTSPSGTNGGRA